jgi:peptidoglycan/xylan/chitin deacetylase (PgdA/CDA1 family)
MNRAVELRPRSALGGTMSAISASRVVADPTACTGRSRRLTAIFALFGSALLCAALALMLPQTAAASSLPGNLLTSPGTQLSGFDADASSWTVYGGTVAANTSQYREGTGSLRMTGPGTTVKIQKTISANMSGGGAVRLWVYLHTDPATTVSGLYIRFSEDTNKGPSYGFGRHFYYYLTGSSLRQGWNLLSIAESGFVGYPSNGVSPSWADTMQEVRIELLPKAGTTASMSVDDLRFGVVSQPVVLLSFKNGTAGQFANAFPVLSTAGFAGTAFIDSSDVGKTGQMTLSQLQSLYGAGWDVGNHSDSSAQLTTLSLSGAESALSDCTNYLLSNGMPRAAHQVAYVDGMYNDTVLQAMHDTGEQSGTYIAGLNAQQFQPLPMDNPYLIPSWDAGLMISGTVWQGGTVQPGGVNAVENKIAAAAAQGSPVEIVFHDVSAAGTTSSQYTVSANDLTAICDFIKQRGLPVVTISQLYALNNDPTMLVQNDHWAPTTTASTAADPQVLGGRIVTLNAVDPMSGVAATTYSLDGAPNATYQGPFPVSPGPHSLTFSSVDKAGNVESLRTMADFQPPVTTAGAAEGAWVSGKGSLKLTSTDALSGGSSVREIDYSLDGGQTWRSTPGASASVVATVEGPATIVFHAVDSAGNVEADQTLDVLVDNTAPTSTLKGVDALPHSSPVTLTLSAVDAALGNYAHGSDVAGISYSIDRATAVTTPGAGPLEFVIPEGDHSVTYWSTDTAGNAEAARTVWVRVSAPLPPNLTTDPGTQVSSFDDASGWTLLSVNGSGGSVTENTSQAHEGSGSLQLTTGDPTTTAGTVIAQMKFSQGIDMSSMLNGATIRFWAYVAPDQALTSPSNILKTFRLRLSPDADGSFTDQFKWETNRTAIHSGWNLITFSASDDMLVAQGNVSWNQPMLYARVEVTANPNQTTPASVSFDDLRYGVRATPAVIMSFDDGDPTVIGSAFPIMQAHGLVGTAYVVSSWVGNPNESSMTLADLKTLYAAGWDIGNHTVDHPSGTGLDTLDLASVEAELTGCRDFLVNNGMPRAALDVAYPGGYANDTVEQAMAATGMQTGRITSWRPMALPIDDGYQVPGSTTAVGTLTLQQIEHRIDQAVADGATIELIFHALGDPSLDPGYPAAPSYYQPIDEFTSICDYIAQQGIPTMTVSQFYAHSQNGPSSDTTPPITTTDYATGWHASPLTVDLTASDAGSGVDYTQYSLDGGHSWTNGNAVTIAASGTTAISYRSADQAGNLEQTKTVAVNVDAAAPVTAATVQPGGWTAGSVTVTLAADDTGGSGLAGTYYRIGAQSAQTYSGAITVSDATPIVYWSADNAGNIEIAKTLAPQIDTTSPVTTATMTPGTGGEAVVTLNASDPLSGVAEIDYSGDGGATWTSVAAAQAQVTLPLNGSMSLRYHAVDNVGNNEGDETYELDGQPPVTSITAGPTAWITAGGATFSWSGTDDWTPAAQLVYQYQLDGGAWSGWASATSATLTGLSEGRHTFVVEARDLSGHVDTSPPSSAFSVDTIAPAASATANPAGWTRSSVTVTFTASDAGSGLVTSSATCTVDGVAHAFTYGSPVSITAPGNHAVAFTIKDVAGNTATAKVNAQIDLSAPTATATASPSGWTNGNVSVNLAATDPLSGIDTGSATYAIDGAAGQPLTWGSPVVVTAVGSHTIAFAVKDLAGNSAAASTTARIDRTAPVTTVNYNSTAWQRANVTLRFTATDSGGSGVSSTQSSTNGGTTWTSGTSRTISTGGQTTVLYRSTDTAGNVETSHTVVVKLDKTAPTIVVTAPASGGTYLRGQVVPAAWTATDATSGINAALTTSQPVANGAAIPTSTFGTKSFSVTATDVAGNAVTRAVSYSVPFASAGVLAPISANGSSSFARGTTVPVAFVLTNSGGGAYSTARPHLLLSRRQADGSWGAEVAAVANPPVSGGNQFTYAGSGRYTFNLSTTALAAGVWRLHIDLGGGGALYAQLTLT